LTVLDGHEEMSREWLGNEPQLSKRLRNRGANERTRHTQSWKRPNPFDLHRPDGAKCAGGRPWETLGPPGSESVRMVRELPPPPLPAGAALEPRTGGGWTKRCPAGKKPARSRHRGGGRRGAIRDFLR